MLFTLATACATASRPVPRDAISDSPDYLGGPTRSPSAAEQVDTAPAPVWRADVGRGTVGALAVTGRVAAVATVDRWVYALDTRTGKPYWRFRGDGPYGTGPVIADGRLFVASEGSGGRLTALDLRTGKRHWRVRVGDVAGPIVAGTGAVFGVTQQGTAFAYEVADGRPRWSRAVGPARSGPLLTGGQVAVLTLTDTLVVVDAATGAVRSRTRVPTSTLAPLSLVDDSTVAVASPDGGVVALALPSGKVRWRVSTGAPVLGATVVARDTVFALTSDCTLWAIPATLPARPDTADVGCVTEAPPGIVRGGVLVAAIGGEVIYYDRSAKRRVWTRTVGGELRHPPLVHGGQILVAPAAGAVVSFR